MFLKFDSFRLESSLSRWQRVGLISEEHRDINQENYIKHYTHAWRFLAKGPCNVSSDKACLSAVNFSEKNNFKIRFLLHFI